ncbi:carbohydrate-binding protein [Flammeovirga agarivorans]|uniref:Carbohydrate-binding protein n=1 Tax=Flammeovirga agarivorans TaxID=2726742 RepID=A0A7X8XXL2_9BACT|nr:carbohydrate-binding protein [Flammeovirga agarivorans]NLR93346.1 carbohydrate-binding protein [Flammeovirga agarivorans]
MNNIYYLRPAHYTSIFLTLLFTLLLQEADGQNTVSINHKIQRYVGGTSSLDRTKFFNLHSNWSDAELDQFYSDYNVSPSRGFWGPFSYSKSKGNPVGSYPQGQPGNNNTKPVNRFVATEHPGNIFKDGLDANAAANWVVEYYKDIVADSDRPMFFEPMNEPFVHAKDFYSGGWNLAEEDRIKRQMAEVFSAIGKKVHETSALSNMKVIGYSAAWPSLEIQDFSHWNENMKMFMDVAGADMDGFSTHLYDGVNVTGQNNKRSGSNSEAILDLIETYSYAKWGTVKPHAITEYGAIASGYGDSYTDIESIQTVRGINHMLFNLLDRENKIDISIPFITDKSTWHLTAANNYQPYGAALFIPTNLGQPTVAGWKYSPKIHFYELWKNVSGQRIQVNTSNPDIQAQGFVNGKNLYIALNNLDDNTQSVALNFIEGLGGLQSITKKALRIYDNSAPQMSITNLGSSPSSVDLISGETVVFEYQFTNTIQFDNVVRDKKYYTSKHLQYINANTAIDFSFNGITTGTGYASLHLGIGRKHNKSKKPVVKINNTTISVPDNWKGYDQANRDDFFGVIEIPVNMSLLQANNTISVTFPDNGGHISSVILEVSKYDQDIVENESISVVNPPSSIMSDTKVDVQLSYTANTTRDIVTEFWSSTSWLGQKVQTVNAGSGITTLSIDLGTAPAVGSGYVIKASIRPVSSNWTQNIDTDQINNISVTPMVVQAPYGGTPHAIPGRVEAEDYDTGGEGVAFHDITPANQGGLYRSDAVDIESCSDQGGGFNIGWMDATEWLEYTVNVSTANDYDFFPRVASTSDNASIKVSVDGTDVTGNLSVPNTGGWQTFQTMHLRNINLSSGQHVIRFTVVGSGFNLNSWAAWASSTSNSRQISPEEISEISIYPNPVNDGKVFIKVPLNNHTTFELLNIHGQLLQSDSFEGDNYTLLLDHLVRGTYILRITTPTEQTVKKIVIQ